MTDEERFDALLAIFDGRVAEVTLREMADELGKAHTFNLVSLIINRADLIAELWLTGELPPPTTGQE